jgi:hypothetical protein
MFVKNTIHMKKQIYTWILVAIIALATGCTPEAKEKEADKTPDQAPVADRSMPTVMESGGLKVYPMDEPNEFPEAALELKPIESNKKGESVFNFNVMGYELGVQTPTSADRGLANSDKGQHIHLIVDNGPYSAHYEPNFTQKLDPGSHVVLAFLSRSYHESVKNPTSFVLTQTTVGKGEGIEVDLSAPHMFYSRPKGTYTGGDVDRILVDFFLVNTTLSPEGNKVKCSINGNEFVFTKWIPYLVEGLELGENNIRLELVDAEGHTVPSPFNPVERTFTLSAE